MWVLSKTTTSIASQLTSTSEEEHEDYTATQIVAKWIQFVFILAAAALNTKAQMLWSEARILRKVKARHPIQLRQSVMSRQRDHAFTELYVSLSKGRHRTYSRCYPFLYYLFTFAIDVVDVAEFLSRGSFQLNIFNSDALIALRLLIYFGSFATFGAVKLSLAQWGFLMLFTTTIATLYITTGYGILMLSSEIRGALAVCQLVVITLFLLVNMFYHTKWNSERNTSLAEIASVMSTTREENFHNPYIELVDLRSNLRGEQRKRLEEMERLSMQYEDFDEVQARRVMSRIWYQTNDLVLFFLVSSMNALMWGVTGKHELPAVVLMGCLETVSTFLLYINETTIESMLFVKLLQLAHISKDQSQVIFVGDSHGGDGDGDG